MPSRSLLDERYELLQRNMVGDVLAEALSGHLYPEDLQARLRPFGIGERIAVLAFRARGRERRGGRASSGCSGAERVGNLVAIRGGLLCAVVDAGEAGARTARPGRARARGSARSWRRASARSAPPPAARRRRTRCG